ncbi:ATP-binding cassette sub-family A member 10-like [Pelobates cultripes]|uniref:ATP-binding cassette sub-family A member 10-like n=1 Tax=Pelobates cultripes TaxID=61616 RepID=A0AAD1S5M1_PELCU|nr:ATP-binding cassette sub-family A member 10-like [Pelobates cultripes]
MMAREDVRETSLCQQTLALLWKNLLLKWRRKGHTILEWLQDLAFVFLLFIIAITGGQNDSAKFVAPAEVLGRLDEIHNLSIGYVSPFPDTKNIMEKVSKSIILPGLTVTQYSSEEQLVKDIQNVTLVGVIFEDQFRYHIRYSISSVPSPNPYISVQGDCNTSSLYCNPTMYWRNGFLSIQASIDSAIIEVTTNHSVWQSMASTVAVKMISPIYAQRANLHKGSFIFAMCISYISMTYLLSLYVTRERGEMREIMKMMRLKDLAFWLSWGLLYAIYVLIIANLMTLVATYCVFVESSYGVILLLFFLYGISQVCFTFMLSALCRNPRVTAIVGFFTILVLSLLSTLLLMGNVPKIVEVLLSIFPPFSFAVGLAESVHMEDNIQGVYFYDLMGDSQHVLSSVIYLILDSVFYMMLTVYFDKVRADKNGMKYEPFFFLKSSYWSREKRVPTKSENEGNGESTQGDYVERIPQDLSGKNVIRMNKLRKIYSTQEKKVEALRDLDLDVYEGQITALLGHSGAGKTTLLNILGGMCKTQARSATVCDYKLSDMSQLEEIKKRVGFCPQFDVKFDPLTVKENLKVFAHIKGIPARYIETEVRKVISELEMEGIENVEASKLSGGQKRKLTFGIAVLGDPQILLLDEPTAGLDPCSRHRVWAMLKEHKVERVTLFSTQFMDEADILADRKAVLSNGRLKCVGSSLFLKRKWGIGYHLRMQVSPSCDSEVITSLIKQHISSAKPTAQSEEELTFTLPFDTMDLFPDLFLHLDGLVGQDIVSYGVSMTTLDDVFLKLEGEAEIEQGDYGVFSQEQGGEDDRGYLSSEMDESVLLMSDSGTVTLSGFALWRQQVLAVARIRFLKLRRETKSFRAILLLLALFLIPLILVTALMNNYKTFHIWELSANHYFQSPTSRFHKYYTKLLVNNNTGNPIEDFVSALKAQNILVDVIDGIYNTSITQYKGAIEVSQKDKDYIFRIIGNPRAQNAFPVLENLISNSFLKMFKSPNKIRVWNNPVLHELPDDFHYPAFFFCVIFLMFASGLTPHFAMSSNDDRRLKALSQLQISGLFPSAYWFGQALVDVSLHLILIFSMIIILFIFNYKIFLHYILAFIMFFGVVGYGVSMVLYVYIISFIFGRSKSHHDRWAFFFVMSGFLPFILSDFLIMFDKTFPILFVYTFLLPSSVLSSLLLFISSMSYEEAYYYNEEDLTFSEGILPSLPYIHAVIFLGIIWFLEWRFGIRSVKRDPVFRTSRTKLVPKRNPEELGDADEEVLAEKERVKNAITSKNQEEKPVIIVDSLRKEFKVKKGHSLFKKKRKAATKNISFSVKKGEVLGLLGPNGAGKTTSISMLAGEMKPTAGERLCLCEYDPLNNHAGSGYCACTRFPTGVGPTRMIRQTPETQRPIENMGDAQAATVCIVGSPTLSVEFHIFETIKQVTLQRTYCVCFAISMLGNPTIVLLDEPSTGLDPKGQQRLWRAIRAAFKNKERGAILTTHYMEEAEAVCDRVAIMVSGKLRCIGSIQQLKSKFGKGYLLEIKVKDSQPVDVIHNEIIRLFPQASRQDRFSSLLVYKVPMENVQSLSQAFLLLEEAKRTYSIEEYSFSQSTLEQVFLELAKEQEKEDFDVDSSFQWKHLRTESI